MSKNPETKNYFQIVKELQKRVSDLEKQLHSASSIPKVGSIILTPQPDTFFSSGDNDIEGNLAYKDSDNKVYVYNGSWTALH